MKADANKLGYIGKARNSDAWFTPSWVIESAREALDGQITLDPTTDPVAQQVVQADRFFTEADDCLTQDWGDGHSIWMNPPYGNCAPFLKKFMMEIPKFQCGALLINNVADTKYFREEFEDCPVDYCMIFTKRIGFYDAQGKNVSGNTKGQIIAFFDSEGGSRERGQKFCEVAKVKSKLFAGMLVSSGDFYG